MLNAHDPFLGFFFGNGRGLVSIVSFGPTLGYSATGSKPKWGATLQFPIPGAPFAREHRRFNPDSAVANANSS